MPILKRKVALFCNVEENAVVESVDVSTIYEVPLKMLDEKLDQTVLRKLSLSTETEPQLNGMERVYFKAEKPKAFSQHRACRKVC